MPNLETEVIDHPIDRPFFGAGAFDLMVAPGLLPEPAREALPDVPPDGSSPEEWNAYFQRLTQRTRELVAKHDAAVQAEFDADAAKAGAAVAAVLGKEFGDFVRDFYRWSYRAGATIGRFFAGGDPGWNDARWVEASLARVAHLGEQGYAAPGPYEGPDRASTDDAIDWEGSLAELERRMNAFWERHPEQASAVDAAIRWGKTHPDDPNQTAIVHSLAWPIPLVMGRPGISDSGLAAVARLLAASNGVDPDWMTIAAFQHRENALAEDLRLRKSGEAATMDASGYYGVDYLFGDLLAALVNSIPDAPKVSAPTVRVDLLFGPTASPFGVPPGTTTPKGTASSSSGGGGGGLAALAAALLFL